MSKGSFADARAASAYMTSLNVGNDQLARCIGAGDVLGGVRDWRSFLGGLAQLWTDPYTRCMYGEAPATAFGVRRALSRVVMEKEKTENNFDELRFAAWCLFEQNAEAVYVPARKVREFASRWQLDADAFLAYMIPYRGSSREMLTSPDMRQMEERISEMIARARVVVPPSPDGAEGGLDDAQRAACESCITTPASVMVGGAGVGKTTTIQALIGRVCAASPKTLVIGCAFTHKARRVMGARLRDSRNLTQLRVSTIHSFAAWARSEKLQGSVMKTMDSVFVVVDETSMLDYQLLDDLGEALRNLRKPYQIAFVGDEMQLPPIGRGEFLRYAVDRLPDLVRLEKCHRTSSLALFEVATRIRQGRELLTESGDGWRMFLEPSDARVYSRLRSVISSMSEEEMRVTRFIAWQNVDVRSINALVQTHMLKLGLLSVEFVKCSAYVGGDAKFADVEFHVGDEVVYVGDKKTVEGQGDLTNAMVGIVTSLRPQIRVEFQCDQLTKCFWPNVAARELQHAYCSTVHKSQGSEYENVVIVCVDMPKMSALLDRRWLYTAVTRAREHAILIGTPAVQTFCTADLKPAGPLDVALRA